MKSLYLLRHGLAERGGPNTEDAARRLAPEGRRAAAAVAAAMNARGLMPDLVLCSTARRALETWEAVETDLSGDRTAPIAVHARASVYLAPAERMLAELRGLAGAPASVLLIAHNPGLHHLARDLAGPGSDPAALGRLGRGFATAALAVLAIDRAGWRELAPGAGRLTHFISPGSEAALF